MTLGLRKFKRDSFDALRSGAVYQIFPDRFARDETVPADRSLVAWDSEPTPHNFFGGNLRGITSRMDYISSLGVKNIYFNPIFSSRSNHRYDAHSYLSIDPLLGTEDDFMKLVATARKHGIGVIIDGVFNHVGDHYPDFVAAQNGDKKLANHFFLYPDGTYQTFGGAQSLPKLNLENDDVLTFIAGVMKYWDKFGIAGWRFDVPYKVPNSVWRKLRKLTRKIPSAQFIVAEAWTDWSFAKHFESVQNYKTGNRILDYTVLMRCDSEDFIFDVMRYTKSWSDGSLLWNFVDSHDTPRYLTQCRGDYDAFLIGFALHMVMPGIPIVYYGTELAMPGEQDPGCRASFPVELSRAQADTLAITKPWIEMRQMPALTHGGLEVFEMKNHAMVFERKHGKSRVEILVNTGYRPELLNTNINGEWRTVDHKPYSIHNSVVPERTLLYRRSN